MKTLFQASESCTFKLAESLQRAPLSIFSRLNLMCPTIRPLTQQRLGPPVGSRNTPPPCTGSVPCLFLRVSHIHVVLWRQKRRIVMNKRKCFHQGLNGGSQVVCRILASSLLLAARKVFCRKCLSLLVKIISVFVD